MRKDCASPRWAYPSALFCRRRGDGEAERASDKGRCYNGFGCHDLLRDPVADMVATMTPTEIKAGDERLRAKVARGLTKAQKDAVLTMPDKNPDRWNRKVRWPTQRVLRRLGLLAYVPLRPTPLGIAALTPEKK